MQVQKIQNNNYGTNFCAKFKVQYSEGIAKDELKELQRIVSEIGTAKDTVTLNSGIYHRDMEQGISKAVRQGRDVSLSYNINGKKDTVELGGRAYMYHEDWDKPFQSIRNYLIRLPYELNIGKGQKHIA